MLCTITLLSSQSHSGALTPPHYGVHSSMDRRCSRANEKQRGLCKRILSREYGAPYGAPYKPASPHPPSPLDSCEKNPMFRNRLSAASHRSLGRDAMANFMNPTPITELFFFGISYSPLTTFTASRRSEKRYYSETFCLKITVIERLKHIIINIAM